MSKRTTIINSLINTIAEATSASCHRGMRFLHEINSFPAIYVHAGDESRVHSGKGVKYALMSVSIRGYEYSDSLDTIEALARSIEGAVAIFYKANRELVDSASIISLGTDEGTLSPYGAVDLQVTILYTLD